MDSIRAYAASGVEHPIIWMVALLGVKGVQNAQTSCILGIKADLDVALPRSWANKT